MTSFASAFHDYQQERRHTTGIRNRKPAQEVRRGRAVSNVRGQRRHQGAEGGTPGTSARR